MNEEGAELQIDEVVVLNKYEGDLSESELANANPLETITVKNGEIVEHIIWKEVQN